MMGSAAISVTTTASVFIALLGAGGTFTVLLPLIFGKPRSAVDTAGAVVSIMESQFKTVSERYADLERRQHDTEQQLFEQVVKLTRVTEQLGVALAHIDRLEVAMREANVPVPVRPRINLHGG